MSAGAETLESHGHPEPAPGPGRKDIPGGASAATGGPRDLIERISEQKQRYLGGLIYVGKDSGEANGDSKAVDLGETTPQVEVSTGLLRPSLEALAALRHDRSYAQWLEAAAVFKHEALRLRHTRYSRHSSVLLALASALTFTEPSEVADEAARSSSFVAASALLSEPFIREPDEERFLIDLLQAGWNLTPAADAVE